MLNRLRQQLDTLAALGKLQECRTTIRSSGGTANINGKEVVDFTSWDFFNLNNDRKLKRVVQQAIENNGIGGCSARLKSGTTEGHLRTEKRLAEFLSQESALLFSSKNQAALTLVTSLVTEGDLVFVEEGNRSPIVDACYLVDAKCVVVEPGDFERIKNELGGNLTHRQYWLFLETLSPVSGRIVDLKNYLQLCHSQNISVVLDESYSLGVVGSRGAGSLELIDETVGGPVACYGDLSRATNSSGAFVAGPSILTQYIVNNSKTFSGEIAPPVGSAEATLAALDLIELKVAEREKLSKLADRIRGEVQALGLVVGISGDCPIVCVEFEQCSTASELRDALLQRGFLVDLVLTRTVSSEKGYLRLLVNVEHSQQQVDSLIETISTVISRL